MTDKLSGGKIAVQRSKRMSAVTHRIKKISMTDKLSGGKIALQKAV
jgi:hypothetical protein